MSSRRRIGRRPVAILVLLAVIAVLGPATVRAGTPGSDPRNGGWVGGEVLAPGPEPLVLWTLPGTNGRRGTCITAGANGPLHGPYRQSSVVVDPLFGELNHLFATAATSDVRLAELSALNSRAYDTSDPRLR